MNLHWLQHCGNWFGFTEPARFQPHRDGGYFVSSATGEPLQAVICNGFKNPERGLAPWANCGESA